MKTHTLCFTRAELAHTEYSMEISEADCTALRAMTDDEIADWINSHQWSPDTGLYDWTEQNCYCEGEAEDGKFDFKLQAWNEAGFADDPEPIGTKKPGEPKELASVETDEYQLCVFECGGCGFHIGLDATYLTTFSGLQLWCPVCGAPMSVEGR